MKTVTLTSKGQITIPAEVQRLLGLKQGDKLDVTVNPVTRNISLQRPMTVDEVTALGSSFVKSGTAPVENTRELYEGYVVEKWQQKAR
ncbi:MAG: AbrB/MazE/SpoVT family DNA-binding domain-containing protein [Candidatus Saccharimonadales bacterium]